MGLVIKIFALLGGKKLLASIFGANKEKIKEKVCKDNSLCETVVDIIEKDLNDK